MKDYSGYYRELNARQRKVVDSIEGPVLVLAGPGTGKTQLLSVRAAAIMEKAKAGPENILILTYTNAAVKSMKERLAKVAGRSGYDVDVGTFHSFANSIIQESEEAANYIGEKIQMNEVEQVRAIEYALDHSAGIDEIRPFRAPYLYLDEIRRRIGDLKRDGISPEKLARYLRTEAMKTAAMEEKHLKRLAAFAVVYRAYEELKQGGNKDIFDERGRYDFDDMILFATEALGKEPSLKEKYTGLYRFVMVDEYQDTNGAQLDMLFTLLDCKAPNLCCVGDDDQSIYRFQGASVGNFRILKERFPAIKTFYLKDNYRSAKELIDISSKLIGLIPEDERISAKTLEPVRDFPEKDIEFREFSSEEEEILFIVEKVKSLKDRIERSSLLTDEERRHPYNNIAILVRKRKDILKIIDAFLHAGIPYATDGKEDISGEKRVSQLLDVLELAHIDPSDTAAKDLALYKVLTSDYFGIPHAEILRFAGSVNARRDSERRRDITLLSEFLASYSGNDVAKEMASQAMRRAASAITALLEDARTRPVHAILMDYIKVSGLYAYILKEYDTNHILKMREVRSLASFVNMVKSSDLANPAIRLDDFMMEMKTRRDHGLAVQGEIVTMTQDGVRIFTAHGSKGQEFHSVIMPFCLQHRNWPVRPIPEKIQLPLGIFKSKEEVKDKAALKQLFLNDETRLFYVAMTRAKSDLIFTASPTEDSVSSFYLAGLGMERDTPEPAAEDDILERSLHTTDLKDPFIGTEEVLKDLVGNMALNPTRLNTYIFCRRKFLYNDVLRLPGPKKKSLVFGNCVHKALEETYRTFRETKRFPPFKFFKTELEKELLFQGPDSSIISHCTSPEQMKKLEGWFARAAKGPVMPLGLERKLVITVGDGILFTGKYDKVEWEDEKRRTVRIVDYKTGKPDGHLKAIGECEDLASDECDGYLRQLISYKLLFEKDASESAGRKVASGELVFIEPLYSDIRKLGYKKGDYVSRRIEISEDMVTQLESLIESSWKAIKELQFEKLEKRDVEKCGRCDFDGMCWG